jgi:tetratricopeptide (TPR) repeat protein
MSMAEDVQSGGRTGQNSGAAAEAVALGQPGVLDPRAATYLEEQTRLARLQSANLLEQNAFELSHLRFRRFSDYARFALETAGFLVVLLIVCGLGAMVWNATRDHDLVVDAFSVPPDVAQSGMTGAVLAGRVLDKFGQMQADAHAVIQGSGSYRANEAEAVRIEIPDTGVSLGELNRYLRSWLGGETHVTGDLVHTPDGFALTTRYGALPGATLEAKTGELDSLVKKSAERIFAAALPYRYVEYLVHRQRFAEAAALIPGLAAEGSAQDRALANSAWAKVYFFQGDMMRALERGREAVRLDPDNPITHAWLSVTEGNLGHDEGERANADAALQEWHGAAANVVSTNAQSFPLIFTAYRDEETGDFAEASVAWMHYFALKPMDNDNAGNAAGDAASDHDIAAASRFASSMTTKDPLGRTDSRMPVSYFSIAYSTGDWTEALNKGRAAMAIMSTQPDQKYAEMLTWPELAYAMAKSGDLRGADALIVTTPPDCDDCVRKRGSIAALEGRWAEAAQDFSIVAARSPHEPYAETDWGAMLLAKGDFDGAIAQFKNANRKGPHFADPLEMWGDALIAKNHSDMALAKFAEADKYAPHWGRLHLKWGEALLWSGNKAEAQKQFAIASVLVLSAADKTELARMGAANG